MVRFSFVILTVLSMLVIAACGSSSSSSSSSGAAQPEGSNEKQENNSESTGEDVLVLKLGHISPENTNAHQASVNFKELVEEKSNGKVKIEIYPFRQLGGDRELLEQMQFGTLDFGLINAPPVSGFAPETAIMDLPFLFKSWDHVENFLANTEVAEEYKSLTESANLKTLSLMARGYRHITNSKKPIETLEDLNGLKIRVIESPIYVQSYQELGASAQSMAWADAYTALEQGAIDAQENTLDIILKEKVHDVNKYVSKTGVQFVFSFLMASQQLFDKYPEDIQQIIKESAMEAMVDVNINNRKQMEQMEEELKGLGMEFNEVDKAPFIEKVQPVYDSWKKEYGDELLNKILELE
ncbi:TRAP transporter substrate-binding protein [Bacillus sp. Marseille-P3661]|uniref:TRAP transporter substrate-binding protein n=1 Tax=Bacillus sp. Marseille-P3661 TaxID=1936234 RepID=UPI0021550124|nr:TRAP transporter substrate-binding protein [Bacillus sp. Marseille-P3661]